MAEAIRRAARLATGLWLAAFLVRFTLKDRLPLVATLHYATPPLVLALAAALGALAGAVRRRPRPAALACAAALGCLAWQALVSRVDRPAAAGELRAVLWNVKNGMHGWEGIGEALRDDAPDLVGLGEAFHAPRRLAPRLPELAWTWPGHGLGLGVRGRVLDSRLLPLAPQSWAALVRVEVRGRPLAVLLVDLRSNPFVPRREAFASLDRILRESKPDLVLGDFNTPRDSVFFEDWREAFRHAFEEAGQGWDGTWPMPVPVLAIDHVWCGPRLVPRAASHLGSAASLHRRVRVDFAFESP